MWTANGTLQMQVKAWDSKSNHQNTQQQIGGTQICRIIASISHAAAMLSFRGETEGQALENAKMLREGDFDWERIDSDMIDDPAEIVEQL